MSQDSPLCFITREDAEVEELPRGLHYWLSRPGLTDSEHFLAVRVHVAPGNGHPFHYHSTMEEIIYVLSGRAEQWIEEEQRDLGPGEMVHIPKGVVHGTYNAGDQPLVFLAVLSPSEELEGEGMVDVSAEEPWRSLKTPIAYPDPS